MIEIASRQTKLLSMNLLIKSAKYKRFITITALLKKKKKIDRI